MFEVCVLQTVAATIIMHGTYIFNMIAVAASHYCVILTYMSGLTDFGVWHCFLCKIFGFDDSMETREFILGQTAYTFKYSSCHASIKPPCVLDLDFALYFLHC